MPRLSFSERILSPGGIGHSMAMAGSSSLMHHSAFGVQGESTLYEKTASSERTANPCANPRGTNS